MFVVQSINLVRDPTFNSLVKTVHVSQLWRKIRYVCIINGPLSYLYVLDGSWALLLNWRMRYAANSKTSPRLRTSRFISSSDAQSRPLPTMTPWKTEIKSMTLLSTWENHNFKGHEPLNRICCRRHYCWEIVLKWGNFGKEKNLHHRSSTFNVAVFEARTAA